MAIKDLIAKLSGKQKPDANEVILAHLANRYSTYPSAGLTPERLTEIFKEADTGDIFRQSELFEEMLEKDLHLFGIFQSRKLAVLKNDYRIVPASESARDKEIATFVADVIKGIRGDVRQGTGGWRDALEGILDAVPKGFSASQIMWKIESPRVVIDRIEWTHQKNFRFGKGMDPRSDFKEIRRLTDQNRFDGVELEPNKWLLSIIKARSGHPARTSLQRTCSWMYLFKNFDIKAWIQFAELYGLPLRLGKYGPTDGDKEKKALLSALQHLAMDASAIIPDTAKVEFVEAAQKAATAAIHDQLAGFCNKEMSKGVLGHTGTTESTPGKLGNEDMAQEVKFDLVESDALAVDYIISDQVIPLIVVFNFGPQQKYPAYKTVVKRPRDRSEIADVYDKAINTLQIPVAKKDLYEELDIRQPDAGEEVVMPRPETPFPFSYPLSLKASDKKKAR